MSSILGRNLFKRRGLDIHIAKLFALRREHGDSSFFEPSGAIRDYARDYLRTWIPVWESNEAREEAQARVDAMLESLLGHAHQRCMYDDPEEMRFREVLGILQDDYPRYYLGVGDRDFSEAQMEEILGTYSVGECASQASSDDRVAFENVLFFK
jgi:hypothetical protein